MNGVLATFSAFCKGGCRPGLQVQRFRRRMQFGDQEIGHLDKNGDEHHNIHESYNKFGSSG